MTERQQCEKLYKDAFGDSGQFDTMLFDLFFGNVEMLKKDGVVVAMYFKIPCVLNMGGDRQKAYYIYAVTTHNDYRHQGLMSRLFKNTTNEPILHFLKPSSEGVINFYKQTGFKQIIGTRENCDAVIEVDDNFKALSRLCDKPTADYPIMIKGFSGIDRLTFEYTLE